MGIRKFKRPLHSPDYRTPSNNIQTITSTAGASTAALMTPIANDTSIALITATSSGAGWQCDLASGRQVGSKVTIVGQCNSTTPFSVLTESTLTTFFGSTFNALVFSTNSSGAPVEITCISTAAAGRYAITGLSAAVTAAGSTGAGV